MDISGLKKFLFTGITINPKSVQDIQNLVYTPPDTGVPDRVKETIDNAVLSGFSKLWRGMVQVAASGFGKGVLLAAVVVIGAVAVAHGFMAGADMMSMGASSVSPTVGTGLEIGAREAVAFLFDSGLGYATLGMGGAFGAIADVMKHKNRITEEIARSQAKQFEVARSHQKAPSVGLSAGAPEVETSYKGYKQPTNGKAAKSVATALTMQAEPQCDSWCQQEESKRAAREIVGKAF